MPLVPTLTWQGRYFISLSRAEHASELILTLSCSTGPLSTTQADLHFREYTSLSPVEISKRWDPSPFQLTCLLCFQGNSVDHCPIHYVPILLM